MSQYAKPAGHVPVPLILFGFVSLLLGVMTEFLGIFEGMTASLRELWKSGGRLTIEAEMGLPGMVGIFITCLLYTSPSPRDRG